MKICEQCRRTYPDNANYCMTCGRLLTRMQGPEPDSEKKFSGGWNLLLLTLGGSLLLSWLLIAVFHLPIFILGAILPLFWISGKSGTKKD